MQDSQPLHRLAHDEHFRNVAIKKTCSIPDLSSDPPRYREYPGGGGGGRRQGRSAKSKLQKTAFFTEVKPLNVYQSTHTSC